MHTPARDVGRKIGPLVDLVKTERGVRAGVDDIRQQFRNSTRGRFGPTMEVTAPDGRGVVYDADGIPGADYPIGDNNTEEGRQDNRHVRFEFLPLR